MKAGFRVHISLAILFGRLTVLSQSAKAHDFEADMILDEDSVQYPLRQANSARKRSIVIGACEKSAQLPRGPYF